MLLFYALVGFSTFLTFAQVILICLLWDNRLPLFSLDFEQLTISLDVCFEVLLIFVIVLLSDLVILQDVVYSLFDVVRQLCSHFAGAAFIQLRQKGLLMIKMILNDEIFTLRWVSLPDLILLICFGSWWLCFFSICGSLSWL